MKSIVIWNAAFEKGLSRHQVVDILKQSWRAGGAPWLVDRRTVELKDARHPDILQAATDWTKRYYKKDLTFTSLSVIVVSDPEWGDYEELYQKTIESMTKAYNASAGLFKKPQFCFIPFPDHEKVHKDKGQFDEKP